MVGGVLVALSALIALQNLYLCFVRKPLYRFRHGSLDGWRNVSGLPVIGTIFALIGMGVAIAPKTDWRLALVGGLALLLDPDGLPWVPFWVWRSKR